MRIIAGLYRGRKLKTLGGMKLRPTGDRLRETLFDVLGSSVEGAVFVDGYAGSGAVGLEALSRGAREVFFLEEGFPAVRIMESNLALLEIQENVKIIRAPVLKGLRRLAAGGVTADFCFFDPPYSARREYSECLLWLSASSFLSPAGLAILEHRRKEPLAQQVGQLIRVRLLDQGSNSLSFYRADQKNPPNAIRKAPAGGAEQ